MISSTLRIFMLLAIVLYFGILIILIRKNSLRLKYSLLWFLAGLIMLILAIWPQILYWFSRLVGISMPVNALYAFMFFFVIIILVALTSIASRLNDKVKKLTQEQAILEERIRELEKHSGKE